MVGDTKIVASRPPETHPSLNDGYLLEVMVGWLDKVQALKHLALVNKCMHNNIQCIEDVNATVGSRKKQKKTPRKLALQSFYEENPDVFSIVVGHLGLHAVNLRQACKAFKDLPLSKGAELALVGLQTGPSIPLSLHMRRRTTRACTLAEWNYFTWRADQMQTHTEWARYRKTFNLAPIHDLINAFECVPEGKHKFFGKLWLGKPPLGTLREGVHDDESEEEEHDDDDDDDKNDGGGDCYTSNLQGSDYTSHLRVALYKAIEERMWDLCMGKDLGKPMDYKNIVPTLKRIFKVVRVDNDRCFHFSDKGWLKYTPFLLAAECHNEDLVRYLAKRGDTCTTALSCGGNNAYAICKHFMKRRGATEAEIAKSPVLAFLTNKCNNAPRSYIPEGHRINVKARK